MLSMKKKYFLELMKKITSIRAIKLDFVFYYEEKKSKNLKNAILEKFLFKKSIYFTNKI